MAEKDNSGDVSNEMPSDTKEPQATGGGQTTELTPPAPELGVVGKIMSRPKTEYVRWSEEMAS